MSKPSVRRHRPYRKSPRQAPAGAGFAEPSQKLPLEWLTTRGQIAAAQARHHDPHSPSRILVINGSPRSEHSCPGEISKTLRLAQAARTAVESRTGCYPKHLAGRAFAVAAHGDAAGPETLRVYWLNG